MIRAADKTPRPANSWRGERTIRALSPEGEVLGEAVLAATHAHLAAAMAATGTTSLQGLLDKVASVHPDHLHAVAAAFDAVSGDPLAVIEAAPGATGLDAIADVLIGLIKGQTEAEQDAEKKRFSDVRFAQQAAMMQAALDPMLDKLAEMTAQKMTDSKAPSAN